MENLMVLGICAIIVQYLTEQTKKLIHSVNRSEYAPIIALFFGLGVAFATRAGIFGAFGIRLSPIWVDYGFTGLAYSGGAVAFNELVKLISEFRPSNQKSK